MIAVIVMNLSAFLFNSKIRYEGSEVKGRHIICSIKVKYCVEVNSEEPHEPLTIEWTN